MTDPRRNIYIADTRAADILDRLPQRKVSEFLTLLTLASDLNTDSASRELAQRKLELFMQEYK